MIELVVRQGYSKCSELSPKHHCQDGQYEEYRAQPDGDPEKNLFDTTTLGVHPASLSSPGQSTKANAFAL